MKPPRRRSGAALFSNLGVEGDRGLAGVYYYYYFYAFAKAFEELRKLARDVQELGGKDMRAKNDVIIIFPHLLHPVCSIPPCFPSLLLLLARTMGK
jgi:hypothetical protein